MKAIFDDYGRVIVLVIVISGCLTMFANFWFGSDALLARIANSTFRASTDSATVTSTNEGRIYVSKEDGSSVLEIQQGSAALSEEIANRRDPILYAAGKQNKADQLLINKTYGTSDLFWAVDADDAEIHKSLTSTNSINSDNYFNNEGGYFRVLSISTGNGNEIISNLSNLNAREAIAYSNMEYPDKIGAAGTNSNVAGNTFNIYTDNGAEWLTYNVQTQQWRFYKSGTYCIRVFVCDSKGKSTTGTVYISIANRITDNIGDGNNSSGH